MLAELQTALTVEMGMSFSLSACQQSYANFVVLANTMVSSILLLWWSWDLNMCPYYVQASTKLGPEHVFLLESILEGVAYNILYLPSQWRHLVSSSLLALARFLGVCVSVDGRPEIRGGHLC